MKIEKIYVREYQDCDFCGGGICDDDAYEIKFHTNHLVVCERCKKAIDFLSNLKFID